ncbi:MAG: hypothetical protein HYT64_00285 [Candidatus Yanofskybacteria bacterium]|nr:hypothetical protein [Candidatus Yanofskybacteria bacterium]
MKGLLRLFFVFVIFISFTDNAWAAKPKILLLKDVKPGTKAIGFSVFRGVEPQPFDVELRGINDAEGRNLILSHISNGPMETPLERIGAISGMSGSPIFVGDCLELEECVIKAILPDNNVFLVGALSYAAGYFIIGGTNALLTSAEYMLGARAGGYKAATQFYNDLPNKISIGGQEFFNLMLFPKMENFLVAENLNNHCEDSLKSDIKPGSMVSILVATGTFNVGASGTVTWRDENDIYVFGHPFLGSGMIQYPFVQVSVADTLQTPFGASKLPGCYLDTKGTMFVDGAFEVSGVIGETAPMLPYKVELYMGNGRAVLSEEVAASPMAPIIIKQLPVLWAQQLLGDISRFSLAYQMRVGIIDQPEIFVRNIIPAQTRQEHQNSPEIKNPFESRSPFEDVFDKVFRSLQAMKESGFDYNVESVAVRLRVVKDLKVWSVKRSFLSQEKAIPGETVYANIILENLANSVTKQISIPIKVPEDFMERTGPGIQSNITVLVQGGSKFTDKRSRLEVNSTEELILRLNESMNYKANVLHVQQITPTPKAEQKADEANAKTSVKPPWQWTDVGEGDLRQLPISM